MWYVIQVKTGSEDAICEVCKRAFSKEVAEDIFVPKYVWLKKYQGVRKKETKVLFPGYVFVETHRGEELEKHLERIASLAKPVCIGGGFYPIREEEEALLRHMMEGRNLVQLSIGYFVEEELVVIHGPLQSYERKICRIDRHNRLAQMRVTLWGEERILRVGLEVKARLTQKEWEELRKEA